MSDQLHALERREIHIHTAAIRAAIYAARGLMHPDHCRVACEPESCSCTPPRERLGALFGESDDTEGGSCE